ncbi:MAG: zinc metallopeptidase [Lachnospiraceae bacterium]|nr:zinc metallopeptidase [Lachnospiraceae bacterium]
MYSGYGYGYGYGMYWDPTYILVIVGTVLCLIASAAVNSTMKRYSGQRNARGITGAEAARRILEQEGLYNVQVECLNSSSGDHYNPRTNTVSLSRNNYNSASVTAVGVAAHECGHAIQHAKGYAPLSVRSALVPVVNIGSKIGFPLILLGVILSWNQTLIQIGIWAFALSLVFQLVTLPVEFNASRRAVKKIEQYGLLTDIEQRGCKKVLTAAAMTYVAAAAASALQVFRLVLLYGGNRRRDD